MAWYYRNNYNFIIILALILLINNFNLNVLCFNGNGLGLLSEFRYKTTNILFYKTNNIKIKFANEIIDQAINNLSIKRNLDLNICRYSHNNKKLLLNFDKRSPFFHYNLNFMEIENILFNLQFSTQEYNNDFIKLTNNGFINLNSPQFINSKFFLIGNEYNQIFYNQNMFENNFILKDFDNFQNFLPTKKEILLVNNFIKDNSYSLTNHVYKSFCLN